MTKKQTNVVVFGGNFSPPTQAHVFSASYLASIGKFDSVFVIPVAKHPEKDDLVPYHMRYEMCRLSMNWIPKVQVSDIEKLLLDIPGQPSVNYTYYTLKKMKEIHPDWNLNFCVGADVAPSIPNWKYGKELLEIATPFVLSRHGFEYENMAILPDISSTKVRDSLKNDPQHKIAKTFLPQPVYDYIVENNLYV